MVVGAAVLAVVVAGTSLVLAWAGPRAVATAVAEDAARQAVEDARQSTHLAAVEEAAHLAGLVRRVETAAQRVAEAARRELEESPGQETVGRHHQATAGS